MAVIVPVDEYRRWQRLAKEGLFDMIEVVWQHNEGAPSEDLEKDVEEAIKALRRERASRQAS